MWFARRDASSHGSVVAAVDQVLAVAAAGRASMEDIARTWAQANGRVMDIEDAPLSAGVFGQWISFPDRDLVQVGQGVVGRDRTIAHELGHMVLGHRGLPIVEFAAEHVQSVPPELVARMLQRSCGSDDLAHGDECWPEDELAAERFAGLLIRRMRAGRGARTRWSPYVDDALG
ncbi:hypothetical protein AOT83_01660 [Mycobacteroides sp. H001]|uniref:hypothetical protein n=1 Tax=Mycobacteroides TaxID=670516 RepID=UPI000714DFA3|nr:MULTISPECIES: hypothetical protein [Mycobacteroides]KRQ20634.1 hypothetical protein AOT86_22905 [Mycobacteroides sp. H072]KRQ42696.1 hypothetical protein AOT84_00610 [Mycobacteroides sp. H002]KRQ48279.1 hypothetical protein AOT85_19295 [Mycobacteroides sp. H054]KRQ73124.1 hypothetical protein AOT83_01660 [Mycobacteroides sp. H001]OHU39130.1 hypothetical protein BKG79_12305 [Mycobacteroides chelonae]